MGEEFVCEEEGDAVDSDVEGVLRGVPWVVCEESVGEESVGEEFVGEEDGDAVDGEVDRARSGARPWARRSWALSWARGAAILWTARWTARSWARS